MVDQSTQIDLGGQSLICKDLYINAATPGAAGSNVSTTELAFLDGATAGTAAASKCVVLDSSKGIATLTTASIDTLTVNTAIAGAYTNSGIVTFGANPTFSAGKTLDLDTAATTFASNATTITKSAAVLTTESLVTAASASQALTITMTGLVVPGDLVFVSPAGGSNTRKNFLLDAVATSNTVTVNVYNNHTSALNGTIIFNLWVVKA